MRPIQKRLNQNEMGGEYNRILAAVVCYMNANIIGWKKKKCHNKVVML